MGARLARDLASADTLHENYAKSAKQWLPSGKQSDPTSQVANTITMATAQVTTPKTTPISQTLESVLFV